MAFRNRIRLPFYLTRPQFPDEKTVFIKADGSRKTQSIVISKVYEGITDKLPEWVHERLKIALNHDFVQIEGERYFGELIADGYEIEWQDFLDYPYGPANFKAIVTPYNMVNSNCKSCEEATQIGLVDDNFPDILDQSTSYEFNVLENDSITCRPFTIEITYTHPVFIETATVDSNGLVTFTTKPLFFQRNTVKILTYRVTCANGAYDEADLYASLTGEAVAVLEPLDLTVDAVDDDSIDISWTAPSTPPDEYEWQLAEADTPAIIVDSGTTAGTTANIPTGEVVALEPGTGYIFSVRSKTGSERSEYVTKGVVTDSLGENTCGRYRVIYFGAFGFKDVTYIDCASNVKTVKLKQFKPKNICALQAAVGVPVSIVGADEITYLNPC